MTDDRTTTATVHAQVPGMAASLIRTWVPIGVGAALTFLASRFDFAVTPETSASVGGFAAMAVAAGYYALARLAESAPSPTARKVGKWMLGGVVSKPVYLTEEEYDRMLRKAGAVR